MVLPSQTYHKHQQTLPDALEWSMQKALRRESAMLFGKTVRLCFNWEGGGARGWGCWEGVVSCCKPTATKSQAIPYSETM